MEENIQRKSKNYVRLEDYPDYLIGDQGDVLSQRCPKERQLKGKVDKDGYIEYQLRDKNGARKYVRGHRLVGWSYLPNPEKHPVINHINGIKNDNRLENLEWCSISYNTQHAFDKLGRVGHNGNQNIPITLRHKITGEEEYFDSMQKAADYLGTSLCNVSEYFKRKKRLGSRATLKKSYTGEIHKKIS